MRYTLVDLPSPVGPILLATLVGSGILVLPTQSNERGGGKKTFGGGLEEGSVSPLSQCYLKELPPICWAAGCEGVRLATDPMIAALHGAGSQSYGRQREEMEETARLSPLWSSHINTPKAEEAENKIITLGMMQPWGWPPSYPELASVPSFQRPQELR